eukprot:4365233-Pleurochrysis_carterae.AAC.2
MGALGPLRLTFQTSSSPDARAAAARQQGVTTDIGERAPPRRDSTSHCCLGSLLARALRCPVRKPHTVDPLDFKERREHVAHASSGCL